MGTPDSVVSGSHLLSGLPSHRFRDTWALWWRDSRGSWAAAPVGSRWSCTAGQQRGEKAERGSVPRLPCAERCLWWRGRVDSAHRMPSRPAPSRGAPVCQGPLPLAGNSAFPLVPHLSSLFLARLLFFLIFQAPGAFSRELCGASHQCQRPCTPRCNLT